MSKANAEGLQIQKADPHGKTLTSGEKKEKKNHSKKLKMEAWRTTESDQKKQHDLSQHFGKLAQLLI